MSHDASKPTGSSWLARVGRGGLLLLVLLICAGPHFGSVRYPSLFDDDLARVGALRRGHFPEALFRPFNEHLAPLFELVSWLAWWGSGWHVERVASGFLVASFLAWGVTLALLAAVVRLELKSGLAAGAAVIVLSLTPVSSETLLWYSASSFQWAAVGGLAGWYAAARASRAGSLPARLAWLVGTMVAALASPLCCALGVLAGPLASLRLLAGKPGRAAPLAGPGWRDRLAAAAIPWFGTVAYLLIVAAQPAHGPAVAASVRTHLHPGAAAWAVLQAPTAVLVPGLIGLPALIDDLPPVASAGATVALIAGIIAWSARSERRGLILTGLGWALGGYALAYLARAVPGDRWIFAVGRYHLFALIGAAGWLAALMGPGLDRAEARRPLAGWGLLVAVAGLVALVQGPRVADAARRSGRYPDQPRAIAATLHLEDACMAEGVSLAQAIRIVDLAQPPWYPRPLPFNPMLYLFGDLGEAERYPDAEARARALARLSWDDRAALCGGLDAGRYRGRMGRVGRRSVAEFRPALTGEVAPVGAGRLCFEEFAVPAGPGEVEFLDVNGVREGAKVEVWWAARDEGWWAGRSVRWAASSLLGPVEVGRLPHWRPTGGPLRIRVIRRSRPFDPGALPTLGITWRG